MKTYSIKIEKGCSRNSIDAPNASGLIFVYLLRRGNDGKYYYHELLEIISAADIRSFLTQNMDNWTEQVTEKTEIYFLWAIVAPNIRTWVLAGLVNFYRPILNEKFLDYFPFGRTEIICEGNLALLQKKTSIGE